MTLIVFFSYRIHLCKLSKFRNDLAGKHGLFPKARICGVEGGGTVVHFLELMQKATKGAAYQEPKHAQ